MNNTATKSQESLLKELGELNELVAHAVKTQAELQTSLDCVLQPMPSSVAQSSPSILVTKDVPELGTVISPAETVGVRCIQVIMDG